ncbi:alpha/beta hydrolase [Jatrophihabitans fulvus]
MTVTLTLADRPRRLARVRLEQDVGLTDVEFARVPGAWQLEFEQPDVLRMEYLFEVTDHNGRSWTTTDPVHDRRAPGAFGEKSVLEFDGYEAPAWLGADGVPGSFTEAGADVLGTPVRVWTPTGLDGPAPLLVVHDGPEFDGMARFTAWLAAMIADGSVPPSRAVLLDPGDRNDWYAANDGYADAVAAALPKVSATVRVGVGASLGGLAMLHLHRRHPTLLGGLFLQSSSFFTPELDGQESGFSGYEAVTSFVASVHDADGDLAPVPTVLTCGTVEENLANNRTMTTTLRRLGYPAELHAVRDAHNFVAWRDALHPHLTELVRRAS